MCSEFDSEVSKFIGEVQALIRTAEKMRALESAEFYKTLLLHSLRVISIIQNDRRSDDAQKRQYLAIEVVAETWITVDCFKLRHGGQLYRTDTGPRSLTSADCLDYYPHDKEE
jgi:hypothetical protein